MSFRDAAGNNEIRLVIVVVVGGLFLLMLLGPKSPPAAPKPAPPRAENTDQRDYMAGAEAAMRASRRVDELAVQTKGDFTKLSLADQEWIDSMSARHGPQYLASKYRALRVAKQKMSASSPASKDRTTGVP
jgi:hypothetical protein